MQENDFVRILAEPEGSINAKGRVEKVGQLGVWVSNGNMPFMGTFCWEYFNFAQVEKL
jgi:hypothetical protein